MEKGKHDVNASTHEKLHETTTFGRGFPFSMKPDSDTSKQETQESGAFSPVSSPPQ